MPPGTLVIPIRGKLRAANTAAQRRLPCESPPLLLRGEDEPKPGYTERLLSMFVEQLEQKVKSYPEQWFNYFNFWGK